jgi:hypothetical protein
MIKSRQMRSVEQVANGTRDVHFSQKTQRSVGADDLGVHVRIIMKLPVKKYVGVRLGSKRQGICSKQLFSFSRTLLHVVGQSVTLNLIACYSLLIFALQELVFLVSTSPKPGGLVCSTGPIF